MVFSTSQRATKGCYKPRFWLLWPPPRITGGQQKSADHDTPSPYILQRDIYALAHMFPEPAPLSLTTLQRVSVIYTLCITQLLCHECHDLFHIYLFKLGLRRVLARNQNQAVNLPSRRFDSGSSSTAGVLRWRANANFMPRLTSKANQRHIGDRQIISEKSLFPRTLRGYDGLAPIGDFTEQTFILVWPCLELWVNRSHLTNFQQISRTIKSVKVRYHLFTSPDWRSGRCMCLMHFWFT